MGIALPWPELFDEYADLLTAPAEEEVDWNAKFAALK